ncbi:hypothetical protein [Saccharicrinis fermentans]|uniref:Uncharacterized protein n=1 Tax=Saccharicrinis fermentans DSM 9555 = JCM 21142 TaxID=869213 RepID=W7YM27_9BACT|nr:hypothetical protein [Saccharicrinis fermentans]GAF03454.1 hypothetical protein JCM21142_52130 [Saccharicrinis fermentans DSM 9555 = JCM 21142]
MEYIELDIKQLIYELLNGKIVPYSVELNCELLDSDLHNLYGTYIYHSDEADGTVNVVADFHCKLIEHNKHHSKSDIYSKGRFKGRFNLEHKCFFEGAYEVSI